MYMHHFKRLLRRILPRRIFRSYHFVMAWVAAVRYGHPSRRMVVIGITGTSGKSSSTYILRHILEAAGYKTGVLSTMEFCDGHDCRPNDKKMTMLGRFQTQSMLADMVRYGCEVAIVETTSEGIVQYRHRFIDYDIVSLTNLYPEHIESHGSFENYKSAKMELFRHLGRTRRKHLRLLGIHRDVPKIIVTNADNEHSPDFAAFPADEHWTFGRGASDERHVRWVTHHQNKNGTAFALNGTAMTTALWGEHNVANVAHVAAIALASGLELRQVQAGVSTVKSLPGRLEQIDAGQAFRVIVDYAFEPKAMAALYGVVKMLEPRRIIHVLGSTGGGRDVSRRETVGEFVGTRADVCIVTDEDPYDDDPQSIIDDVAFAVAKTGKKEHENLFRILDRREAIAKALSLAQTGDLILVTGKGSEQAMVVRGQLIPWDDRQVVREELRKIITKTL
jgi:UDP-N-acetylmuramoyl-L-alanyl-D-glutamate--2,6-diaminopimelate ligase